MTMVGVKTRPVFTDGREDASDNGDSAHHCLLTFFEIEERPEIWSSRSEIAICG
jgi:hypothetical protein